MNIVSRVLVQCWVIGILAWLFAGCGNEPKSYEGELLNRISSAHQGSPNEKLTVALEIVNSDLWMDERHRSTADLFLVTARAAGLTDAEAGIRTLCEYDLIWAITSKLTRAVELGLRAGDSIYAGEDNHLGCLSKGQFIIGKVGKPLYCSVHGAVPADRTTEILKTFLDQSQGDIAASFALALAVYTGDASMDCYDTEISNRFAERVLNEGGTEIVKALAAHYAAGIHVAQDFKRSTELFKHAAQRGDAEAMFTLGIAYERGMGVTANSAIATEWFTKAAKAGHTEAAERTRP